jgi:molecular chaperone GrpE
MTAPDNSASSTTPPPVSPEKTPALQTQAANAGAASADAKPQEAASPTLEQQLDEAKKAAAKNHEHYVRAMADLENFRRRAVREKDELRQFAAGRVLEDLLPVIDNLSLAINAAKAPNADLKKLLDGIDMVLNQLKSSLSGHGLKEINPVGQKFDPHEHESISSIPSADVPEGAVAQVVRIGYGLNGRLLRPASVILSSGPAKPETAA